MKTPRDTSRTLCGEPLAHNGGRTSSSAEFSRLLFKWHPLHGDHLVARPPTAENARRDGAARAETYDASNALGPWHRSKTALPSKRAGTRVNKPVIAYLLLVVKDAKSEQLLPEGKGHG
jgi:hypothetical protein